MDKFLLSLRKEKTQAKNDLNSHGLRKGTGTYVTLGTTCPSPISSVAVRGEWSMGRVFDVYWTFCMVGDFYLGKLLQGMIQIVLHLLLFHLILL